MIAICGAAKTYDRSSTSACGMLITSEGFQSDWHATVFTLIEWAVSVSAVILPKCLRVSQC